MPAIRVVSIVVLDNFGHAAFAEKGTMCKVAGYKAMTRID